MTVIGYKKSSFKPQDSRESIFGYTLYLTEEREGVEGLAVERAFISDWKMGGYHPQLGDEVDLVYNRYGKIQSIALLTPLAAAK